MNITKYRQLPGVPLIAFCGITAIISGTGVVCAVGSNFGGCSVTRKIGEEVEFAFRKTDEKMNIETKSNQTLNKNSSLWHQN